MRAVCENHLQCESGVESEEEHRGGKPTEDMSKKSLAGAHF
jgi:hypothetical protein